MARRAEFRLIPRKANVEPLLDAAAYPGSKLVILMGGQFPPPEVSMEGSDNLIPLQG